jgi:TonB family protein
VQAISLVGLVLISLRVHQSLIPPADYRVTALVSPEPLALEKQPTIPHVSVRPKPSPERKASVESKPLLESKPAVAALVVTPQIRITPERKLVEPDRPAPELKLESKMPVIPTAPASKIVATGTFSPNTPVAATTTKPTAGVQTGGFGDPNGVPASAHATIGNIRETGSFDLAGGAGPGNGIRATSQGVVASSGFGDGAISAVGNSARRLKADSHQPTASTNAPVEITFKPKPDYTDEGRKQKINGEVRLEVLFKSDGQIHVVRVVQGLGYGLDEQAVKAAEQIKFKPALHEGQPIDSLAQVHIIFELIS